jgi:hypothetical protein
LRAAGWALVVDEPIGPTDIIVVASESDAAGLLEAADLVRGGIASRVAVFADSPNAVYREFIRRGIPYEDRAARSARQLRSLGVTVIEEIPKIGGTGTEAEGRVLLGWCEQHGFRSVVVVSSRDHSRRLHRLMARAMEGRSTRVTVRAARHSTFDPEGWWKTRDGVRTEIIELQKLFLDVVLHPLS